MAYIWVENYLAGDPPDNPFKTGRSIKGTESEKSSTWQTFQLRLRRIDRHFVRAGVAWWQKCDLWIDKIRFVPAKLYTDAKLAGVMKIEIPLPPAPIRPGPTLRQVFYIGGLYHRLYGVEALLGDGVGLSVRRFYVRDPILEGPALEPPLPEDPKWL